MRHSRGNKRLKRKICFALNDEWKSYKDVCDDLEEGLSVSVASILASLAKYKLLKKKKVLVRYSFSTHQLNVYKLQDNVTVNDLLNALSLKVMKVEK